MKGIRRWQCILGLFSLFISLGLAESNTKINNKKANVAVHNIVGNPVDGRDNYIINSTKPNSVTIECTFVNSSKYSVNLAIWTHSQAPKPTSTLTLAPGSKAKPTILKRSFSLNLKPETWCLTDQNENSDCGYFAIADAKIKSTSRSSTAGKNKRPKFVSYQCHIMKPSPTISFYSF